MVLKNMLRSIETRIVDFLSVDIIEDVIKGAKQSTTEILIKNTTVICPFGCHRKDIKLNLCLHPKLVK